MKKARRRLWMSIGAILLFVVLAGVIDLGSYSFRFLGGITELKVREGLDLQGGSHLVYEAEFNKGGKKLSGKEKAATLTNLRAAIERRVNAFGVSETQIQTAQVGDSYRVIAELPGVKNTDDAIAQIGKTAQLKFYEVLPTGQVAETPIRGSDLGSAKAGFDTNSSGVSTNTPIIAFTLKSGDPTKKFAELTTRINKENGQLKITLDQQELFNGSVSSPIINGAGQMTGFKDSKDAESTATLLNAGSLPVPIKLVEQRTVGASLGQESIARSVVAGIIGLIAVALFMLAYYRLPGLIAVVALGAYSLITFAIFKGALFWLGLPPVTLTLAGVAGFILSIGMAVDANILIFERFREELRGGRDIPAAIEAGFARAWTSIRDSNVSTLITCAILYLLGTGPIRGFALTLALGVLVSLFSAITVTRTLLKLVLGRRLAAHLGVFSVKPDEVAR